MRLAILDLYFATQGSSAVHDNTQNGPNVHVDVWSVNVRRDTHMRVHLRIRKCHVSRGRSGNCRRCALSTVWSQSSCVHTLHSTVSSMDAETAFPVTMQQMQCNRFARPRLTEPRATKLALAKGCSLSLLST
jgi:hypothetical protein